MSAGRRYATQYEDPLVIRWILGIIAILLLAIIVILALGLLDDENETEGPTKFLLPETKHEVEVEILPEFIATTTTFLSTSTIPETTTSQYETTTTKQVTTTLGQGSHPNTSPQTSGDTSSTTLVNTDIPEPTRLTAPEPEANVGIKHTISPNLVFPGATTTYSVTITNIGRIEASGVMVKEFLPEGLIYADDETKTKTLEFGTILPNGGEKTASYSVHVAQDTPPGSYTSIILINGDNINEFSVKVSLNVVAP